MEKYRPWRGHDDFGGYVYSCIVEDLAKIAGDTGFSDIESALQEANFTVDHLPKEDCGPDWENDIFKEVVESATGNCLDIGWFFLEYYLYRRILGELGYYNKASTGYKQDPWRGRKEQAFGEALDYIKETTWFSSEPDEGEASLLKLIADCAWASDWRGSKASLVNPGSVVVDDSRSLASFLQDQLSPRACVMILVGYVGLSLACDLRFVSWLVQKGFTVEIHAKPSPCGPLLATRLDVEAHIHMLAEAGIGFSRRLAESLRRGEVTIHEDALYAKPYELSAAPQVLKLRFDRASLIIATGDDNFRRMCGDRQLPNDFPFARVASAITTRPIASLRTCRAPLLIGIAPGSDLGFSTNETDWCAEKHVAAIHLSSPNSPKAKNPGASSVSPSLTVLPTPALSVSVSPRLEGLILPRAQVQTQTHSQATVQTEGSPSRNNSYDDGYFDAGNDYYPASHSSPDESKQRETSEASSSSAKAVLQNGSGNEHAGLNKRKKIDQDSDADADNENDADDLPWAHSLGKLGLEACLEEFGTKDGGRPYIRAHLPERVKSALEHFAETRKGESEGVLNEHWSNMPKVQKQRFEMLAQQDKNRYDQQVIDKAREVALALRAHYATN